jgi:hypothetical protein
VPTKRKKSTPVEREVSPIPVNCEGALDLLHFAPNDRVLPVVVGLKTGAMKKVWVDVILLKGSAEGKPLTFEVIVSDGRENPEVYYRKFITPHLDYNHIFLKQSELDHLEWTLESPKLPLFKFIDISAGEKAIYNAWNQRAMAYYQLQANSTNTTCTDTYNLTMKIVPIY